MGTGLFGSCINLKKITVDSKNGFYDSRNDCNAIIDSDSKGLLVACSASTIPAGITAIGQYAFSCCLDIENVIIPEGITKIDNCAFSSCVSLKRINLPQSLNMIGADVFRGCS